MWFSSRGPVGYRTKEGQHYKIDYAESIDGITWIRRTETFALAGASSDWDKEMTAYATVLKSNNTYFMLYNGNNFGKTGFGYAVSNDI